MSDSSQFSIEVGGEVVGQEVRSGQARVLVQGLLCDFKAHGGVRNSSQELLQEKDRGETLLVQFVLFENEIFIYFGQTLSLYSSFYHPRSFIIDGFHRTRVQQNPGPRCPSGI